MARYRPVLTSIWVCDDKFQDYSPEGKLLFLYLITNEHINEAGIYKITFKTIANETDIPKERVIKLIKGELSNNISYDNDNNVIFVHKFLKFNGGGNPKLLKKSIEKDRELIKTSLWKEFDLYYSKDLKPLDNSFKTVPQHTVSNSISNRNSLINDNSTKRYNIKKKCSEKYSELAVFLEKKIKERLPRHKFQGKVYLDNWANTFRIMVEKKEANEDEIRKLIIWVFDKSDFWYRNILSADKLRKQFARLWDESGLQKEERGQKEFNELLEKIESKGKK